MRHIFLTVLAAVMTFSLSAQDLTILHFNDTHSHIDPQRSGDLQGRGGVIEQAAFIEQVREEEGKRNVLLVHAGDFGQGTSYFTELGGNIEIDVMNDLGFDVVTLGNHEFDNGADELARRLKNLKADVVCANYDFTGTSLEGIVKPYTILRRGGKKIGVIGLLTDVSSVVDISMAQGIQYQEPAPIVNELAGFLKNKKKCDLVICLSHLGYGDDKRLAGQVRDVDIIVGGHSHTHLEDIHHEKDLDGKDVKIVQNWKWGLNVGKLTLDF